MIVCCNQRYIGQLIKFLWMSQKWYREEICSELLFWPINVHFDLTDFVWIIDFVCKTCNRNKSKCDVQHTWIINKTTMSLFLHATSIRSSHILFCVGSFGLQLRPDNINHGKERRPLHKAIQLILPTQLY